MTSFVNPAASNHQGAERAEQALSTLRHIGVALTAFPLQVLRSLPQGWNHYIAHLEQHESDDELLAQAQRDSQAVNARRTPR
ncbi:MAG: hypothetical protein QM617_02610 [Comamonas sp.]